MKLVPKQGTGTKTTGERKILFYRSPMDPNITSPYPTKDPMGMDFVPVYEDEATAEGVVAIDPTVVQNMNVKIEKVVKRRLSNVVVTNGILTTNETKDYFVTTRVSGWIEKLYINYTGQKVRKGDKLMDIYSPELVSAQQELLTALSYKKSIINTSNRDVLTSGDLMLKNAIRKLQLLEMSSSDIDRLMQTQELKTYVTLYAKTNGTVISKDVLEGQSVAPGMPLLKISDLSTLWLTADIYEYELSKIALGSPAEIRFNFMPGKVFKGKINFIYPNINPTTRTVKIRIELPNPNDVLKPAMFANVTIYGKDLGVTPVVPENAVIRSGQKDIIIVALGGGKFKPQEVTLGGYSQGYYQVLSGLSEGTDIVTSAQFLIDSESNLRAAISQFTSPEHSHTSVIEQKPSSESEHKNHKQQEQILQKKESSQKQESIIRKGVIDLNAIDKNKDGKVFQDLMDWNVISDEPGTCPICEMKLKEVTLEKAKQNLIEHGFKVK
jgi:Cu(I)/Ag(I) efflux system membrane fusion protein/cobalt-zinc-cadmium efflux system membrane fusion protein